MSEYIKQATNVATDRCGCLDADWAPVPPSDEDLIRRNEELNAVLRKWRAYIYTQRIMRAAWDKVIGLMIAAGAIFLWAMTLAILVGMAAR